MKRSMFVLFALCGLLWPAAATGHPGHGSDGHMHATDPRVYGRFGRILGGTNNDTLYVVWDSSVSQNFSDPNSNNVEAIKYRLSLAKYVSVSEDEVGEPIELSVGEGPNKVTATQLEFDAPPPFSEEFEGERELIRIALDLETSNTGPGIYSLDLEVVLEDPPDSGNEFIQYFYQDVTLRPPVTDPNLRWRYGLAQHSGLDTIFVDWSTVYNKATGLPAVSYDLQIKEESFDFDREGGYASFTSLVLGSDGTLEEEEGEGGTTGFYLENRYAHIRRDTLLLELEEEIEYRPELSSRFPIENFLNYYLNIMRYRNFSLSSFVDDEALLATLSVDPAFVREDAGATTIEIKAQLAPSTPTPDQDLRVTLVPEWGLNERFYLDAPKLVIKSGQRSATGQITLTPINDGVQNRNFSHRDFDNDYFVTIRTQKDGSRREESPLAHIRLLDDDRPTSAVELSVSDPAISIDGRATDVTVTGTLNGALLDESVSFSLVVMPPTTASRDTDFGIRLARLTIPAGQATGTTTVLVTPQNQNGGQIWLGVAEHPTIGTGSNQRIIIVKEVPIELTRQPSKVIAYIEVIPDAIIREDAGQVNVDLKVVLKDALPVDETVRFEIVGACDNNSITRCLPDVDVARRETDYSAELSPLAIPAGQKEGTTTLSLEIVDNSTTDKPRVIWVVATLGNSRYARGIFIEDDETPTSTVLSSASPTEIAEDSGQTTITITGTLLGSVLSESLTFGLTSTEDDEVDFGEVAATRDVDYTAVFEPLTIPAGQATGTTTLTITPTPNDGKEQDEVIYIGPVSKVKITENGQEREIRMGRSRILLKDVADAPSVATPTEEAPSSLAFDPPASTVISGTVGEGLSEVLPTAQSDPEGELTYRVFNLPAELTFDATTRTITGTPTAAGETSIEYYVLDEGVSAVLTYTIDIQEKPVVIVELGGIAANPLSVREDADEAATVTLTVSLRKAAKEDATITLAIVGPTEGKTAKLNEDFTATLPATITIPAGKTKGTAEITLLPKDNTTADGNKALAVLATSPSGHQALINIQIIDNETASTTASTDDDSATSTPDSDEDSDQAEDGDEDGGQAEDSDEDSDQAEDSEDTFAFASTVDDQAYTEGGEITPLVLPEATGGEGAITYRCFDLPAGLVFDAATHTLSGTPTAATDGAVEITYLAQDSAEVGITLTFSITVNPALSFGDLFDLFGAGGG